MCSNTNGATCHDFSGKLGGKYGCETVDCGDYVDENTSCGVLADCRTRSEAAGQRECDDCNFNPTGLCLPCTELAGSIKCIEIIQQVCTGCRENCDCEAIDGCLFLPGPDCEDDPDAETCTYVLDSDNCPEDCSCDFYGGMIAGVPKDLASLIMPCREAT